MAGYFAFVSLYALHLGLEGAAPYLSVYAAVVIGLRVLGAKLPDRVGARRLSSIAMLVGAAGLLLIGLWPEPTGLMVGTALFASGVAFMFPALSLLVVSSVPDSERGAALGTFTAFLDVAFGLGPVAFGLVVGSWGYEASLMLGAEVDVAGAALLVVVARPRGTWGMGRVLRPAGAPAQASGKRAGGGRSGERRVPAPSLHPGAIHR